MVCLHCNVAFFEEWTYKEAIVWDDKTMMGQSIAYTSCPNCNKLIVKIIEGEVDIESEDFLEEDDKYLISNQYFIHPKNNTLDYSDDIPNHYREDLLEAESILKISPKASAALLRRLLQRILTNEYKIEKKNFSDQISIFIENPKIPTHIIKSVDAIRNIGNFSAHPLKNTSSGEIIDVEPGEAEWSLEVMKSLLDFTFVQPARIERLRKELNLKLKSLGKPEMI